MEFRRGDILRTDINIIAHGCNTQGVMGSGVALQIKTFWQSLYESYKNYCNKSSKKLLGTNFYYVVDNNEKVIVNAFTQEYYGTSVRQVNYAAIVLCFKDIAEQCQNGGYLVKYKKGTKAQIALPKIGAGRGGGNWEIIKALLLDIEVMYKNIEFVVYEL